MVRLTSARPSAGRLAVPAKMTSSIFWLRTALGAWAPSTQAMASTTLDLPDPLGPTTTVTPGSNTIVVLSANDLKPLRVRLFKNTAASKLSAHPTSAPHAVGGTVRAGSGGVERSVLADRAEVGAATAGHGPTDPSAAAGEASLATRP